MNILVVGGGGREHAIAWKLASEPRVETVYVAPGNAGTDGVGGMKNVVVCEDEIPSFVVEHDVTLVIVGPEAPLCRGLADRLRAQGSAVVGPNADGAFLEGSKAFCKDVMVAAGVPTAAYAAVSSEAEVHGFVDAFSGRSLVVKADGLAGGKGVVVCEDAEAAREAAIEMLRMRPFGEASAKVVLEERLYGIETSYIVLTDGSRFVSMPTSQDHKRLLDGDEGPNTGGMGAFSPAPFVSDAVARKIEEAVIEPTLAELRRRGIDYRGFLYAGIMLTDAGPMVLEFNVRLGDPETQALMMALGDGFLDALVSAASGRLTTRKFSGLTSAATVVLAAAGYPVSPETGASIRGLETSFDDDVMIFHAGTRVEAGSVQVAGGRVLGVTARGANPVDAVRRAYDAVEHISWAGMQFRNDIGKALQ